MNVTKVIEKKDAMALNNVFVIEYTDREKAAAKSRGCSRRLRVKRGLLSFLEEADVEKLSVTIEIHGINTINTRVCRLPLLKIYSKTIYSCILFFC